MQMTLCYSPHALHVFISTAEKYCVTLDLTCNNKKTVCIVLSFTEKSKIIISAEVNVVNTGGD